MTRFASLTFVTALLVSAPARGQTKSKPNADETFRCADGKDIRYQWSAPAKIEPEKRYPLVVCLHGAGGNTAAPSVLVEKKMQEKYPCFILTPRTREGQAWGLVEGVTRARRNGETLPQVVEVIKDRMAKDPIDAKQIYVTGQSLGGIGSWAAAARYPDLFAAAVPVCGAWDVKDVEKMVPVPVWAFHGEKDGTVPTKYSRELTAALTKAGGTAKYTEFPGVGHGSWNDAYAKPELWEWLFEQKKK